MSTAGSAPGESTVSQVDSADGKIEANPTEGPEKLCMSAGNSGTVDLDLSIDSSSDKKKKTRKRKSKERPIAAPDSIDVLQPGVIISPEGTQASGYDRQLDKTGEKSGARPKVESKKEKHKGGHGRTDQNSPRERSRGQINLQKLENPSSQKSNDKLDFHQGYRPNSSTNTQYRNEGKPGGRPGSGKSNRLDGHARSENRPGSGSPYRQETRNSNNQYRNNGRDQGQPSPGQGQPRRDRNGNRQNQQYRNTPGGKGNNSTPKENQNSAQRQGDRNTPRTYQNKPKQPPFEPYMSPEDLQRGLKLGHIIQGPIRINPKNYEEAYIPHPDGVSDIFVCGMKERNRALNGDIVAVVLHDRANWKIHVKNLKDLEEKHQEVESSIKPNEDSHSEVTTMTHGQIQSEVTPMTKSQGESDSEPDVIIESEEIIDLTTNTISEIQSAANSSISSKQKMNQSSNSKSLTADKLPVSSLGTNSVSSTCSNSQEKTSCDLKNVQDITNQLGDISIDTKDIKTNKTVPNTPQNDKNMGSTPLADKSTTPHSKTGDTKARSSNRGRNSSQKNYSTLQEVMNEGSDVVKNLFSTDDKVKSNSANRALQRTGKVVSIIEPKHSRASTGHIHLMPDRNPDTALFKPLDHRLPRIMIPMENCPKDFTVRPEDHANTLFICRITEWKEDSMYSHGELMRSLGEAGEIEPETEGILIENDVDYSEFTEEMLSTLPVHSLPWQIPEGEITGRRDFRQQCVFTIDPATARDLDDALSCEKLDDGTYNVGVHIADVSYFLKEDTSLDKRARFRATSVYLVQKVIPMLPRILCEELCSLNPNQDRLTFSVVWNMSEKGEIYGEWFGRTVIRSCVKLSYQHAQGFIEEPEREWTEEELPPISDGYPISQIKDTVHNLQMIAKNLRKARFDEGALRLDQVKLQFTLDQVTGMPNGYSVYKQKDSNRLVEEFMLLANMAVAHKIKKDFPKKAFLRRHPPPQSKMVDDLVELCSNLGFPIDPSSAGTLQRSLWRYADDDNMSVARMQVLVSMCSKPMQNAKYFCTGCIDDEELYHHYALNVPLYTHFTSPIRRYADVMVHRTLGAALDVRALQNIPEHLKSLHTYFIKSPGESDKNEYNHKFHENEERKKSSKSSDDSSATPSTENITCKKSSKSFEDLSSAPYTEYFAGKTSSESFGDSSSAPDTEDVIGKTFSKSFVMFDDSSSTPYTEAFTGKTCSKLFDDLSAVPYTDDCIGKTSSKSFDDSSAINFTEALAGRIACSAILEGSSSLIATLCEEGKKKSDIRMILRKIRQQTPKGLSIGIKDGMIYGISAETMRALFNKMLEDESYANLIANTTGSLTLVIIKYTAICNEFEKGNVSKIEMNRRIIKLLTLSGIKLSIISTVNPSIVPMIAICLILKVGDRLYGDEVMHSVFKQYGQYMNNCDRKIVDGFVADLPKRCK
ncbi:DIS3-like exonuclease 2 [Mytilus galloprovincialis]|uniref:DIS3-like exonuclease 2 n=1 Tax=Mytilus galloprovincialis TaxID=29158 RepID=A0A8B6EYL3_MYTGA|nr:DIS3-like exonuclease 2 [Mytilus galloprovincialis]